MSNKIFDNIFSTVNPKLTTKPGSYSIASLTNEMLFHAKNLENTETSNCPEIQSSRLETIKILADRIIDIANESIKVVNQADSVTMSLIEADSFYCNSLGDISLLILLERIKNSAYVHSLARAHNRVRAILNEGSCYNTTELQFMEYRETHNVFVINEELKDALLCLNKTIVETEGCKEALWYKPLEHPELFDAMWTHQPELDDPAEDLIRSAAIAEINMIAISERS